MKNLVYSTKDIAEMAGVSVATVSRVINQSGRFSKETEDRVLKIIKATNFRPNHLARSLRTSKAKCIGILVPDITNEFFAKIILEMQNCFFAEGYFTLIFNTNEDNKMEKMQLSVLESQRVDGLVCVSVSIDTLPSIQVPIVFIDRKPHSDISDGCVLIESDNFQGGVLATEELIRKGCKNIACVYYNEALSTHGGRADGFRTTMEKHGLSFTGNLIMVNNVNFAESQKNITALFAQKPWIDGIFCTTDTLAIGAIKAANALGLNVPNQVKIVGFDGTSIGLHSTPSLTTVRQNVEKMGELTVQLMLEMLGSNDVRQENHQIAVELIARGST